VIESARIVAHGKIKTSIAAIKKNIAFWNDLHHLGLTELRAHVNAAIWSIANCIITLREIDAQVVEIHLIVAHHQSDYRWVYGLQPDQAARESWNRIVQLIPRESWDKPMQLLGQPIAQIRSDIAELTGPSTRSELARLVRVSEIAQAQYGKDAEGRATPEAIRQVEEQIAQAEQFKREQELLPDLTSEQLADAFLQMSPEPKTKKVKRVRRQTQAKATKDDQDNVNPKRKTTEAIWRMDWQLIEPLFKQREKIGVIARQLHMTREHVSDVIQWATAKPK